jgi:hypothetical protein
LPQWRWFVSPWAAHTAFWQKAIEDYGKEYLLMGKLAGSLTSKAAAAAQYATQEESAKAFPWLKTG